MRLRKIFAHHYLLSLLILGAFMATNRYIYGWDDQALEIPLLKHLIDPQLYAGDYYVESLKENFSSYMYPLLAKVLRVEHIPAAYLTLYILSRYFFFLFSVKLWHAVSGKTWIAVTATLMSFLIGRTEEFLYRTFSHQEFALAIIMAGLYCLYRDRTLWAAALFGLAANFNALYALLPMLYLGTYLLLGWQWKRIFTAGMAFVACALPFLCWVLPKKFGGGEVPPPGLYDGWMELFLLSCPQNFLFQTTPLAEVFATWTSAFTHLGPYLFLLFLYLFNVLLNEPFRRSRPSQAICLCGTALIAVSFFFMYIVPNRLVIDLNLIRNLQYINFILMGFTTCWVCRELEGPVWSRAVWAVGLIFFLGFNNLAGAVVVLASTVCLFLHRLITFKSTLSRPKQAAFVFAAIGSYVGCVLLLKTVFGLTGLKITAITVGTAVFGLIAAIGLIPRLSQFTWLRGALISTPLVTMAVYFGILHYNYVQITTKGGGFWQLQRNWEEMQSYVQKNTPKDALIMVPYNMEMGGFRIGSERSIIVSYRDCGIVGFDYPALKEWERRISDMRHFKVIPDGPIKTAIVNGLGKYGADYIVFTRFAAPKTGNAVLTKLHENELFSLFRVNRTLPRLPNI